MSNFLLPEAANEKTIFSARLIKRTAITKNQQRTFFLTLEFESPVPYKTGDSLAIYPENSNQDVIEFCNALKISPDHYVTSEITVMDFLKKKVSLNKWTSKMSQLIFNESKLPEELKNLENIGILNSISISKDQALELIKILPPQMPRYYSIASSPLSNPCQIDLLVSLNSFDVNGILKYGVASMFLCLDAPMNYHLHGFIHAADHFRIPQSDTPIIMIGPGTGVAPFRAFIQERITIGHSKNWLFFGERHKETDFYFRDEFIRYADEGDLKLSLAFSRDQDHKIYVQDLMIEQKKELYDWIQKGAIIYICGDAKNMAKSVETALVNIIAEYQEQDPKSVIGQLRSWRKEGRYNLDVY
jgi:sulfite reductase (NADPH) flavoprotein alpha-component